MKPLPFLLMGSLFLISPSCFSASLEDLAKPQLFKARRSSSYDRTGGNADNRPVPPGETVTIADIKTPGCITHLWFTQMYEGRGALRNLVLRAYFDGSPTPCIEAPLGDYFGLGHSATYAYASEPLAVGTWGGLNSYWRMPFHSSARLTVTNEGRRHCNALYYYVDYEEWDEPRPDEAHFHAQYRQAFPCVKGHPYVILEATGTGHYVGCNLSIEQRQDSWWGEGDDRFFIDGETTPSIVGTGSEDYFSGAWCYWNEFAYPYIGMPFRGRVRLDGIMERYLPHLTREEAAKEWHWPVAWRVGDLWNVYRYHVKDPVPFKTSLRLEIEHGYINNEREDNYSSVAYWYQSHPHGPQPKMPKALERMPDYMRLHRRADGKWEGEDFVDVATASAGKLFDAEQHFWGDLFSRRSVLEWTPAETGDTLTLPLDFSTTSTSKLELALVATRSGGKFDVQFGDELSTGGLDLYQESVFPEKRLVRLGPVDQATTQTVKLKFTALGKMEKSEGMKLMVDWVSVR